MSETDKATNDTENNIQLYEVGYLLVPTISEDEAIAEADQLKSSLQDEDVDIVVSQDPVMRDLAYSIDRVSESGRKSFDSAFLGWVQFNSTPGSVEAINKVLEAHDTLLRHLLIKIDEPTTLDEDAEDDSDQADESEDQDDVDPAEIDEAIDELVIE